jgi:hypothetical protein
LSHASEEAEEEENTWHNAIKVIGGGGCMSNEPILDVPLYGDLILCVLHGSPFPEPQRAQRLLLGTVAQESAFTYTQQIGGGPARGYFQVEPATETSIWQDFLAYHADLSAYVTSRCGRGGPDTSALEYDMVYGMLLARILYYWRDPAPLPAVEDVEEQAARWKQFYNTPHGAGTESQYVESYNRLVRPYYPARAQG